MNHASLRVGKADETSVPRSERGCGFDGMWLALRFFSVWGPGQRPDLALENFRRRIEAGKPLVITDNSKIASYLARDMLVMEHVKTILEVGDRKKGYAKGNDLANLAPKDLWELSREAKKALRRVRKMPRCLRPFWVHSTPDLDDR